MAKKVKLFHLWTCAGRIWNKLNPIDRADILNKEKPQRKSWSSVDIITRKRFMESVKDVNLCRKNTKK